jgi:hypothetical protein
MSQYREIVNAFKDFSNKHRMVAEFRHDPTFEDQSYKNKYLAIWVVPDTTSGDAGSVNISFRIFFVDILQASRDNSIDVFTDTLEVAKDFISFFTDNEDYEWTLNTDFTLTPLDEFIDDRLGGWELDCTIITRFGHGICDLPMNEN